MKQIIHGIKLVQPFLKNLTPIANLIYFEGALLTHFKNAKGDNYLYSWCESDTECNRWLIFRVTSPDLALFLEAKEITLRQLILNPIDGFLYMVDLNNTQQYQQIWLVSPTDIPVAYLPDEETYYDFEPLFYEQKIDPLKDVLMTQSEFAVG